MFSCARICVEFDLEKYLLEAINISMEGWNHMHTIDYDKIPFKCKVCHEYIHFAKFFPKKTRNRIEQNPREGWNKLNSKKGNKETPI